MDGLDFIAHDVAGRDKARSVFWACIQATCSGVSEMLSVLTMLKRW